ncbi:polysaccharide deacetylase family protein [Paenibacillus sp. IHBB 10380]|uniref:polysaccharide deacetylase family protein n=1 Tax=Paenibacillus sp. IHBB 10380 TaxID=1566358 RepID=UPI00069815D7|nr:polysaccharide deacetylase family protein [Paenibacillus sp. IHBB 10380]
MLGVEKTAYLTIDEGPAGDFIEKVDCLNVNGIQAIWFCLGEALENFSEEAIYAISHGQIIGNRSYNHADLSEISLDQVREQLERTDRIIDKLYARADVARPFKVFRFPYLSNETSNEHFVAIQGVLEELGYQHPLFENIRYGEQNHTGLRQGLHVGSTWDTFDLGLNTLCSEERDRHLLQSNEIVMIHDWISIDPFKALMAKLIASGISFTLPQGMSLNSMSV